MERHKEEWKETVKNGNIQERMRKKKK